MIKFLLLFLFFAGCKKQPDIVVGKTYVNVNFPACEEDPLFCDEFDDLSEEEDENSKEQK